MVDGLPVVDGLLRHPERRMSPDGPLHVRHSRAMQQWHAEAEPLIGRLMKAEDDLVSVSEAPAIVVVASCDQLDAAVRHAQLWLQGHCCPDQEYGIYLVELITACFGLCVVLKMVAAEAPQGQWIANHDLVERVGTKLMDKIEQANRARHNLSRWDP